MLALAAALAAAIERPARCRGPMVSCRGQCQRLRHRASSLGLDTESPSLRDLGLPVVALDRSSDFWRAPLEAITWNTRIPFPARETLRYPYRLPFPPPRETLRYLLTVTGGQRMRTFLAEHSEAFDPDEVHTLVAAFDKAWETIQASGVVYPEAKAETVRAILAKHIIAAAKNGERDHGRLRDGALLALAQSNLRT